MSFCPNCGSKATGSFCPNCGTSLYCHFSDPNDERADWWAMNVRAIEGVDMSKLEFRYADQKSVPPLYDPGW